MTRLLAFTAVAVLTSAWGGATAPIRPGEEVATMTLVRGTSVQADLKLFDSCDPVILKPGSVRRSCRVPHVRRLFVGYGEFEPTRKALARSWSRTRWSLWLDGRAVDLPAFGTSDRILYAFPAAGGKDVVLREWKVILVGATPGKHRLRYRSATASATTDATWTFTVS